MNTDVLIGKRIDGFKLEGNIIVQTPAYLTAGVFNVIDEFQFLSFHNRDFIMDRSHW